MHGLHLLFVLLIIVIVLVGRRRLLFLLSGVGLLLFFLLDLAQGLPFLRELVGLGLVVGDDNVVEDGAALDLPQIEPDEAKVLKGIEVIIVFILRVGDLLGLPDTLALGVGDSLHRPLSL